jgi:hypothetical protein
MTERLADRLKVACRAALVVGTLALVWLYLIVRRAEGAEDLPFTLGQAIALLLLVTLIIGAGLLLGTYLSLFLGVDVFGLNRLSRLPRGKPFEGLATGEEERLHLGWTRGGMGLGANMGFKLLLTNRRLLAGSSLTSWYLLEIPLDKVRLVERLERRWGPTALRFHLLEGASPHWDLTLVGETERAALEEELSRLGLYATS